MAKGNFVRLEDMSEVERRSWATLIVDSAVFIWLWSKLTTGFGNGFQLSTTDGAEMVGIFIMAIVITVILHAVIAAIFTLRAGEDKGEKDERDIAIMRRGAAAGFWVLTISVNVLAGTLLLQYIAQSSDGVMQSYLPPIDVINPPVMVFSLVVLAYVGDMVKNAVMVSAYRCE